MGLVGCDRAMTWTKASCWAVFFLLECTSSSSEPWALDAVQDPDFMIQDQRRIKAVSLVPVTHWGVANPAPGAQWHVPENVHRTPAPETSLVEAVGWG